MFASASALSQVTPPLVDLIDANATTPSLRTPTHSCFRAASASSGPSSIQEFQRPFATDAKESPNTAR